MLQDMVLDEVRGEVRGEARGEVLGEARGEARTLGDAEVLAAPTRHGTVDTEPDHATGTPTGTPTGTRVAGRNDAAVSHRRRVRRPLPGGAVVDRAAAQAAVADLLTALGRNPASAHLADTPRRVADALIEMTTPEEFDFTTFPNDENYDDMVVEIGIPIHSLCEHHLLPFYGVAHIAYIPGDRILGISKLARVARMFARDLQVQERLTAQIANWLDESLHPRGVGVVIEAEHLCQSLRGVKAQGTTTVTSALRGTMRSDSRTREEFLSLTRHALR